MLLRIKDVLKKKNISQIELSELLGISKVGVNKLINGNPTAETLLKIANVLDVDIKDLFISTKETEPIHLIIKNELEVFDNIDALKKHVETL